MPEYKKVMIAGGISVLVHVSLFTALALMPAAVLVPVPDTAQEKPLEVTIETSVATPEPDTDPVSVAEANVIRTQLDPVNLKKAEKPPEHPVDIAAYNSQATPFNPNTAQNLPEPTPAVDSNALTLKPVLTLEATPQPENEIGIDALGDDSKAIGDIVGQRWYENLPKYPLPVGQVHVQFEVDAKSGISNIKVISNTGAPENAAAAIRILKEVKIPPELLKNSPNGHRKMNFTFTNF